MIDIELINEKIKDYESHETTISVCERLAALYTVRNEYYKGTPKDEPEFTIVEPIKVKGIDSHKQYNDFIQMALDLDDETLTILNEHMERLKIICSKEYNRVMDELRKRGE